MLRAHVQSLLQTLILVCLLVRFPSFWYPQINVYVNKCWNDPPKGASVASAEKNKELFDFLCHVCCGSWWKLNFLISILIYKEVEHNFFVDQYSI